jgi:hypothetical protein
MSNAPEAILFCDIFPDPENTRVSLAKHWRLEHVEVWRFVVEGRILGAQENMVALNSNCMSPIFVQLLSEYEFEIGGERVKLPFSPEDTVGFVIQKVEELRACKITGMTKRGRIFKNSSRALKLSDSLADVGNGPISVAVAEFARQLRVVFESGFIATISMFPTETVGQMIDLLKHNYSREIGLATADVIVITSDTIVYSFTDVISALADRLYCTATSAKAVDVPLRLPDGEIRGFAVPPFSTVTVLIDMVRSITELSIGWLQDGEVALEPNRLICSLGCNQPAKVLTAIVASQMLEVFVANTVFRFALEETHGLARLTSWIRKRFDFTSTVTLCGEDGAPLPPTWEARPGLVPVVIRLSYSGTVLQVLEFEDASNSRPFPPLIVALDATPSDVVKALKVIQPGHYRFYVGQTQIFADPGVPICTTKLPMGPIRLTISPVEGG